MYYHMTTVRPVGKGTPLPGYNKRETRLRTVGEISGIMSTMQMFHNAAFDATNKTVLRQCLPRKPVPKTRFCRAIRT